MKVLILSSMYPNSQIYLSGIFVHEGVKSLNAKKIDVTVVAPIPYAPNFIAGFNPKWKKYNKVPQFETIDGINIHHPRYIAIPGGYLKQYWGYIYANVLLKLLKRKIIDSEFDIIHAHGSSPDDFAAYLISRKLHIPYVITVHGETVFHSIKKPARLKNSIKSLTKAHKIIAVSEVVKKRIKKYIDPDVDIKIIYNGFNFIQYPVSQHRQNDFLYVLFVATLVERKGCAYLLKAFSNIHSDFPNVKLVIAGGGELLNNLKILSKELGIERFVNFMGHVEHNKVLNLMQQCDIFILPSWDEAFGVVYLEALSFKKPVIACENQGISDLLEENVSALFVKPANVESIYEKLSILIKDEGLRNRLGLKGYERIQELTWNNNAEQTIKLYYEVCGKKLI